MRPELIGSISLPDTGNRDVRRSLRSWVELLQKCYTSERAYDGTDVYPQHDGTEPFLQFIDHFLNFRCRSITSRSPNQETAGRIEEDLLNGNRVKPENYCRCARTEPRLLLRAV